MFLCEVALSHVGPSSLCNGCNNHLLIKNVKIIVPFLCYGFGLHSVKIFVLCLLVNDEISWTTSKLLCYFDIFGKGRCNFFRQGKAPKKIGKTHNSTTVKVDLHIVPSWNSNSDMFKSSLKNMKKTIWKTFGRMHKSDSLWTSATATTVFATAIFCCHPC